VNHALSDRRRDMTSLPNSCEQRAGFAASWESATKSPGTVLLMPFTPARGHSASLLSAVADYKLFFMPRLCCHRFTGHGGPRLMNRSELQVLSFCVTPCRGRSRSQRDMEDCIETLYESNPHHKHHDSCE
jgi:hypothetical protein